MDIRCVKLDPNFVYDEELNDFILDLYYLGSSSTKVAVELGITRKQLDSLRSSDPQFDKLCEFGENLAQSKLEVLALQGALGNIKNFNNTILQFLLKSQYPDIYNDKKDKNEGDSLLEQLTAGSLKLVREPE